MHGTRLPRPSSSPAKPPRRTVFECMDQLTVLLQRFGRNQDASMSPTEIVSSALNLLNDENLNCRCAEFESQIDKANCIIENAL